MSKFMDFLRDVRDVIRDTDSRNEGPYTPQRPQQPLHPQQPQQRPWQYDYPVYSFEEEQPVWENPQKKDDPKGVDTQVQVGTVNKPQTKGFQKTPVFYAVPKKNIKLTIVLVENSNIVWRDKEIVKKIVSGAIVGGKYCIINYGEGINLSEIEDDKKFKEEQLFTEVCGEDVCLFDAISILEKLVNRELLADTYFELKEAIIKNIEIVGIGRAKDTCSKINTNDAMQTFQRILMRIGFASKYYCIDDTYFTNAAEIGFRSIGAIHRTF